MSDASTRSYILLSVTMETTWGCAKLQLVNRSLRALAYLSTSTKMTGAYRNSNKRTFNENTKYFQMFIFVIPSAILSEIFI